MGNIFISDSPLSTGSEQQKSLALGAVVLSKGVAKEKGFMFSPGHPVGNRAYRQHPLAHVDSAGKAGNYIAEENYGSALLEEREAEFLKILICLGADNIRISTCASPRSEKSDADTPFCKGANALAGLADIREFELVGVKWLSNSRLDRSQFPWLAYEPAWEAVVMAREEGGCTSARVELKQAVSKECEQERYIVDVQFNDVVAVKPLDE